MDAIVLAGGRGRRMGALTLHRQKGCLNFFGKPIINHVIDGILRQEGIDRVIVAGGYRSIDVRAFITMEFEELVKLGVIQFLDFSVQGNLVRLAHTLRAAGVMNECFACGIDALVSPEVLTGFFDFVKKLGKPEVAMPVSPRTNVAPSHPRLLVKDGVVVSYCPKPLNTPPTGTGWQSSLGIRYVSGEAFNEIKAFDGHDVGFLSFAKRWQDAGRTINAHVFTEEWHHFGVPADFVHTRVA